MRTQLWTEVKFVFVAVTIAISALLVPQAGATPPTKNDFTFTQTNVIDDVCAFTVTVESVVSGTEIDYFDESGAATRINATVVEQDTYSANGKTLVGLPFHEHLEFTFDKNGTPTSVFENGVLSRVPLPDGTVFMTAGRIDFVAHGFAPFLFIPDHGHTGNTEAFCAALSP
jgi:hypothetical protein